MPLPPGFVPTYVGQNAETDPILTQSQIVALLNAYNGAPVVYPNFGTTGVTVDPSLGALLYIPITLTASVLALPAAFANPFNPAYQGRFYIVNTTAGTLAYSFGASFTPQKTFAAGTGLTFGSVLANKTHEIAVTLLNGTWYLSLISSL